MRKPGIPLFYRISLKNQLRLILNKMQNQSKTSGSSIKRKRTHPFIPIFKTDPKNSLVANPSTTKIQKIMITRPNKKTFSRIFSCRDLRCRLLQKINYSIEFFSPKRKIRVINKSPRFSLLVPRKIKL